MDGLKNVISFCNEESEKNFNFTHVDDYIFSPTETIITHSKGAIIIPLVRFFGLNNKQSDIFITSSKNKKCYNSLEMRNHICRYLNYFIKFYDPDMELLSIMNQVKYLLDYEPRYKKDDFIFDIVRYILSPTIRAKVERMVEDNYTIDLTYRPKQNQALQYDNRHGKMLMQMTLFMNMIIPLATHFIYTRNVEVVDDFLLEIFDPVINAFPDVDMFSKLCETSNTSVKNNRNRNPVIWQKQDIRGKNVTTHSLSSVHNIILNIMPKYTFNQHMVNFNFTSIKRNIGFQITDIEFEYNFIPLSSSKRDEDSNSDYDKFESFLVKQNEAKYLQNKVNCEETCDYIDRIFGPFDPNEIAYYEKNLQKYGETSIQTFQKELVFYVFYKYFGDTVSIYGINNHDYIKMIIAAKRIMKNNSMLILPEILSGKIEKYVSRKSVNKSMMTKIKTSSYYQDVIDKYRDEKLVKRILSIVASIVSSEITFVNYEEQSLTGNPIPINQDIICEEVLMFSLLI